MLCLCLCKLSYALANKCISSTSYHLQNELELTKPLHCAFRPATSRAAAAGSTLHRGGRHTGQGNVPKRRDGSYQVGAGVQRGKQGQSHQRPAADELLNNTGTD